MKASASWDFFFRRYKSSIHTRNSLDSNFRIWDFQKLLFLGLPHPQFQPFLLSLFLAPGAIIFLSILTFKSYIDDYLIWHSLKTQGEKDH